MMTPPPSSHQPPHAELCLTVERQLASCRRHGTMLAVLSIGFEDLHSVADLHGREVEAKFVRALWTRMCRHIRTVDVAQQAAADEFSLVLLDVSRRTNAVVEARLTALLAETFRIDGLRLSATVCTGVALFPDSGTSADQLLRAASQARTHRFGTCVRRN